MLRFSIGTLRRNNKMDKENIFIEMSINIFI